MKNFRENIFRMFGVAAVALFLTFTASAQQVQRTSFDISDYKMDVQLSPAENKLAATVDVTFTPAAETRNIAFELNGSLNIESITRVSSSSTLPATTTKTTAKTTPKPATGMQSGTVTFVQDRVGVSDLGPSVKVDLGESVPAGTPVTLRFKYSGVLVTAEGGPLLTKRLAYVGANNGYLMYAARWFPFHDYAADRATSDISISIPTGYTLAGYSDLPVTNAGGRYRFVNNKPALIGNFSYDRYTTKSLRFGDYELQFYTKAANETLVSQYGETLGRALDFYTKRYGVPNGGKKLIVGILLSAGNDFYGESSV
jgi:aminopeptidase N